VSDMGLMLDELGWPPDGDSAVPVASQNAHCSGPVTTGASQSQGSLQQLHRAGELGRDGALFVGGEGNTGGQWETDWSSQGGEFEGLRGATPQLVGELAGQQEGGRVMQSSAARWHDYGAEQATASGMSTQAATIYLPGLGGSCLGREQSIPGMAPGIPRVGRAFPPTPLLRARAIHLNRRLSLV